MDWEKKPKHGLLFGHGDYLCDGSDALKNKKIVRVCTVIAGLLFGASSLVLGRSDSPKVLTAVRVTACEPNTCQKNTPTPANKFTNTSAAQATPKAKPILSTSTSTTLVTEVSIPPSAIISESEPIDKAVLEQQLTPAIEAAGLEFIDDTTGVTGPNDMMVRTKIADCALLFSISKSGEEFTAYGNITAKQEDLTNQEMLEKDTTSEGKTAHVSVSLADGIKFQLGTTNIVAEYLHTIAIQNCQIHEPGYTGDDIGNS